MTPNFQPVNNASLAGEGNGIMQVLRSGKLITIDNGSKSESTLEAGTTVTGTYLGATPNKFNEDKSDYNLRADDGTLIILGQTASLALQFGKVSEGDLVQVVYNGRKSITRKNGSKVDMHDFQVLRAVDAE